MSSGKPLLSKTVALVGMMGAGKTSIGKRLAARLDVGFCDADHEIEAAAGMTVAEIFANIWRAGISAPGALRDRASFEAATPCPGHRRRRLYG